MNTQQYNYTPLLILYFNCLKSMFTVCAALYFPFSILYILPQKPIFVIFVFLLCSFYINTSICSAVILHI